MPDQPRRQPLPAAGPSRAAGVAGAVLLCALGGLCSALAGCGGGGAASPAPPPPGPGPGLSALDDEFSGGPALDPSWSRLWQVEQWPYDQLEALDVGGTRSGWLTLVPHSSTWYQDYRGELTFKAVSGDLVVTAHVESRNRAGTGAPARAYSLAGLMLRAPRQVTPATWTPGGEDYVFLSLGCADLPGSYQTEVKTTDNSVSTLDIAPGPAAATLRAARIGPHVILLLRPAGGSWSVHRRYRRDDFPATLQAGLTVYTDWPTCSALTPQQHNTSLLLGGTPDLRAQVDYVRFVEPAVPAGLLGADLSNPAAVSDAQLLAFLGID